MTTASELMNLVDADRQARGMSHTGYAAFLNISKTYWTRLRNGQRPPTLNVLKILKEQIPTLRPDIDNYIAGLTENDSYNSARQALREARDGIK